MSGVGVCRRQGVGVGVMGWLVKGLGLGAWSYEVRCSCHCDCSKLDLRKAQCGDISDVGVRIHGAVVGGA